MAFGFEVFNHTPRRITLIEVTRATTNQSTGKIIPATESERDIVGAFDVLIRDDTEMEARDRMGSTVPGDACLYTEETLQIGDRVRVYLDDGATVSQTYKVSALANTFPFLTQHVADDRKEYTLVREESQKHV